jgi:hypothetical protein
MLSLNAGQNHVTNMFSKPEVVDRTQASLSACEAGLPLPDERAR